MPYIWAVGLIYLGMKDLTFLSVLWCITFVLIFSIWRELKPMLLVMNKIIRYMLKLEQKFPDEEIGKYIESHVLLEAYMVSKQPYYSYTTTTRGINCERD